MQEFSLAPWWPLPRSRWGLRWRLTPVKLTVEVVVAVADISAAVVVAARMWAVAEATQWRAAVTLDSPVEGTLASRAVDTRALPVATQALAAVMREARM
jgi:hypothetical protein